MTRKKLPKAITHGSEDLREIAAATVPDEEAPTLRMVSPQPLKADAGISALPIVTASLPSISAGSEPLATRRRALARRIVERYKLLAAVGGLFPLPIVNVAGVTAIILRMVKTLSDLYGVPFERDRTQSIIIGLMGGAAPTGVAAATASTLAFVVPGGGVVGLAVSSLTAAALTRGIGLVFVERFENGMRSSAETEKLE